jgi:hypothetical protein
MSALDCLRGLGCPQVESLAAAKVHILTEGPVEDLLVNLCRHRSAGQALAADRSPPGRLQSSLLEQQQKIAALKAEASQLGSRVSALIHAALIWTTGTVSCPNSGCVCCAGYPVYCL